MPFVKGDPNINKKGRIKPVEQLTPREKRNEALLGLLRKFRPHVSSAIMQAVKIMETPDAADTSKLKAATIILDHYKNLVTTLYDGKDEEEVDDIQPNTPAFSLHVLPTPEEK